MFKWVYRKLNAQGLRPPFRHRPCRLIRCLHTERRADVCGMRCSALRFLVNNAGTAHHNSFEKTTDEELDGLYIVHWEAVEALTRYLAKALGPRGITMPPPAVTAKDFSDGAVRTKQRRAKPPHGVRNRAFAPAAVRKGTAPSAILKALPRSRGRLPCPRTKAVPCRG